MNTKIQGQSARKEVPRLKYSGKNDATWSGR
jgi:hypothetical protein